MNVILFGPPGIGKSTLIGALKSAGYRAVDLEDIYPSKIRFQIPAMVDGVVFGAADLNPARTYTNTIKVLLYMKQEKYDLRRSARDAKVPGKGAQKHHEIDSWLKGATYDYVVDADSELSALVRRIGGIINGKEAPQS